MSLQFALPSLAIHRLRPAEMGFICVTQIGSFLKEDRLPSFKVMILQPILSYCFSHVQQYSCLQTTGRSSQHTLSTFTFGFWLKE